jgi:hypothetical protein
MPNVAPKLIAKVDNNLVYLVDYVMGTTYTNLKINPASPFLLSTTKP